MNESRYKLQYLLVCCAFGTLSIFVRNISRSTAVIVSCRAWIAVLFLACYMAIKGMRPDKKEIRANIVPLLVTGLSTSAGLFLLFNSYRYTSVAVATLVYFLAPVILSVLAAVFLKEHFGHRKLIALFTAFCGMLLVSGVIRGGLPQGRELIGILNAFFGAFTYALYMLYSKLFKPMDKYVRTACQLLITAASMTAYTLVTEGPASFVGMNVKEILLLLCLGIFLTGAAYVIFFEAMSHIPSSSVSILSYADPTVAVFVSALFFREPVDIYIIIGAVLIIGAALFSELGGMILPSGEKHKKQP